MLTPLIILGAGGCARDTLDLVDAINDASPQYDMLGFIVDAQYGAAGDLVNDKPILGDFTWLERYPSILAVCGVGSSELRRQMVQRATQLGVKFTSLVHPTTLLTSRVSFGVGTVVLGRCTFSNQVRVGDHVHISINCTLGHDAMLDNYVSMAPGVHVSGNVHLKEGANIGTGTVIIERKVIGDWSIVGAGSTVVKDVPANSTVVGVPGKVIKERAPGWHHYEDESR
jgi:sugar O-acyltransferase (sialic acid O-acetyltransferase NeuD family)